MQRPYFYHLPKIKIPQSIEITNDLEYAAHGKDLIVISTPTQFIRKSLAPLSDFDFKDAMLVSVSKGIENKTYMLVSNILSDIFKKVKSKN